MRKKIEQTLIVLSICLAFLFICYRVDAVSIDNVVEKTIEITKMKLKYFHYTGDFAIFYDLENNKHIVGLNSEQDIKRFRRDHAKLWCFVPAQILRNYLVELKIPAYILLIRSDKKLQPDQWDYHMVVAINVTGGKIAVIDISEEDSGPSELEAYLRRFENKSIRLTPLKTNEELEMFLHPTEMMKPKKKFMGKTIKLIFKWRI